MADWPELNRYPWFYHSDGSAARGEFVGDRIDGRKHRIIRMHQQLCPCEPGYEPDHRDLNRLNNRRSNLRVATRSEQLMNQRLKTNNRSGFKGVAWNKRKQKWQAYVKADGKQVTIGLFDDKRNAILCRRAVAKFLHKDFYRETA